MVRLKHGRGMGGGIGEEKMEWRVKRQSETWATEKQFQVSELGTCPFCLVGISMLPAKLLVSDKQYPGRSHIAKCNWDYKKWELESLYGPRLERTINKYLLISLHVFFGCTLPCARSLPPWIIFEAFGWEWKFCSHNDCVWPLDLPISIWRTWMIWLNCASLSLFAEGP